MQRRDRAGCVGLMEPCLTDSGFWITVGAGGGVDVWDDLFARAVDVFPSDMDVFQKCQIFR